MNTRTKQEETLLNENKLLMKRLENLEGKKLKNIRIKVQESDSNSDDEIEKGKESKNSFLTKVNGNQ